MNCRQCTDNLTAYLDGELGSADSARVQSHMEACASCTIELNSLQEAAGFVESHKRELEIRPESWNAVYDRITAERATSPFSFLFPKQRIRILATAAVVAAFALGYVWYQHNQERNLDDYIAQYVKAREAGQTFRPAPQSQGFRMQTMTFLPVNPFTEAKPAPDTNPFRLEDR